MLKNTRRAVQAVERDIARAERTLRKEVFWFNVMDRFGFMLQDQDRTMQRQGGIVANCERRVAGLHDELGRAGVPL